MTDHTVVRRAEPSDLPTIRMFRLRALRSDPSAFGSTYEREAHFADVAWTQWIIDETTATDPLTLLAFRGTVPIGMVAAFRDDTEPGLVRVNGLWVAAGARRSGVGRGLLEAAEAWILSRGGSVVRIAVTDAAPGAWRLYEARATSRTAVAASCPHAWSVLRRPPQKACLWMTLPSPDAELISSDRAECPAA